MSDYSRRARQVEENVGSRAGACCLVRATDLNFTSPTVVAANLRGNQPSTTYIDTTAPPAWTRLFYRVEVQ